MDVLPPQAPGANVVSATAPAPQVMGSAPAQPPGLSANAAPAPATGDGESSGGLAPAISKLFGTGALPQPAALEVSYRVLKDPNEIVTVFTDPQTGEEVAQCPPEIIVGLAEFFDQQQGATLDRNA